MNSVPQSTASVNTVETLPAIVPTKNPADFDWTDTESVILREQPETACYFNPHGDLVIRQRGGPDEDSVIIISKTCVDAFLDKLTDACGIPSVGRPE
jgi:hypothetical protein